MIAKQATNLCTLQRHLQSIICIELELSWNNVLIIFTNWIIYIEQYFNCGRTSHTFYPIIVKLVNKYDRCSYSFRISAPTRFLYEIRENFLFAFQNILPLAGLLVSCFFAKAVSLYEWAFANIPNFVI